MGQSERILFLSASGVLNPLVEGRVGESDLTKALFFVDPREVQMDKYALLRLVRSSPPPPNALDYCTLFLDSFAIAESEGRGVHVGTEPWQELNSLLLRHKYPPLVPPSGEDPPDRYAFALVVNAVIKQRLHLRVLWC